MKSFIGKSCLFFGLSVVTMSMAAEPAGYINGIIGSSSSGRAGAVPPGVHAPFGMVFLSPDTDTKNHTSGYHYGNPTIEGFSLNHMSGVGFKGTFGNFQVMPVTGPRVFHSGTNVRDIYQPGGTGWESAFDREGQISEAGYYKVNLDRYKITTELTCTPRAGLLRFTFPKSKSSAIQIDLARKIGGRSELQHNVIAGNDTIKGWIKCWGVGEGFAKGTKYKLFYYAKFSKPWDSCGLWNQGDDLGAVTEVENEDLGFYANYSTAADEQLLMKVGISYVSMKGAQANLEQELAGWDFDSVRRSARTDWNRALTNAFEVSGGTEDQKKIFYTALYRVMTYPCVFTDVDGHYFGADKKIHRNDGYTTRMGFSGWDVYRHEFPLLTLIRPDVVNDEVNTMIDICNLTGKTYPLWQLTGDYTGAGLGDPGLSVVVDAYMKGIRNFDVKRAYEIALQEATGPDSTRYFPEQMNSHGYVYGHRSINISLTLENTYGDWCISRFAEALGRDKEAAFYRKRAIENYKKLFDPAVGWMRQKDADGKWKTPWTDQFAEDGCKEGNTYQWTWFVPHNVQGLINLMGESRFLKELDAFFAGAPADFPPGNPYYNHSNEPVHQVISYFNFAGQPWRTQYWTRTVLNGAYGTDQNGLAHNDDFGQLSAWYVLNAIGLNPVAPGENIWHIGSPVFDQVVLPLHPEYHSCSVAKTFTITAKNNSTENIYVQSATLNGKPLNRAWITHDELSAGGTLALAMGPSPSKWASEKGNRPPSASTGNFPPAPGKTPPAFVLSAVKPVAASPAQSSESATTAGAADARVKTGYSATGYDSLSGGIANLSSVDAAQGLTAASVTSDVAPQKTPADVLFDGAGSTGAAPDNGNMSYFWPSQTGSVSFEVDLGREVNMASISTYTAHKSTRNYQHYNLYASNTKGTGMQGTLIATVDVNTSATQGGYTGATIQNPDGKPLGSFRYLTFDTLGKTDRDQTRSFYQEIDVFEMP